MGSKYQLKNSSLYYEDTEIPKNKFNIKNSEAIHELEKELLEEAYEIFFNELDENTIFDEYYYRQLHQRTFESLYEWAGQYRDFNMAKGESRFCQGEFLVPSSKKIFTDLKKDNYLKDFEQTAKIDFVKKIAYYKCELNALHPFYELNGRVTRMFFDMIVAFNGYKFIDYSTVSPEFYIAKAIECVQFADSSGFEKIILDGMTKP
ncbi:MAG: Fic family protein [Pseudomonadota bacterium]